MPLFSVNDVRKTFANGELQEEVLKGVNFSLKEGELTALVGASGSGKSTLLTIAAGLQSASSGNIFFDGQDLSDLSPKKIREIRASQFGFVFQFAHLVPFLTVEEQLLLMLDVSGVDKSKKEKAADVQNLLQLVEMAHRKDAYPNTLSGGEKQRVAIARALIHKPKILFADEPTASLDSKKSKQVMTLIQKLTKTLHFSTLIVTHDEEMLSFVDHVIKMSDGIIVPANE